MRIAARERGDGKIGVTDPSNNISEKSALPPTTPEALSDDVYEFTLTEFPSPDEPPSCLTRRARSGMRSGHARCPTALAGHRRADAPCVRGRDRTPPAARRRPDQRNGLLRDLYREAQATVAQPGYALRPEADRIRARLAYEQRAQALAVPHLHQPDDLARVLAERVERFLAELFNFVECPTIPSENNPVERTFRPIVIGRKIWGGSRSAKGSLTKTVLLSLFITWQLRDINPLEAIPRLLLGQSSLDTAA